LTETTFSTVLEGGWITDARSRIADTALHPYRADGKMKLWLIPGDSTFECEYRVDDGGAYVPAAIVACLHALSNRLIRCGLCGSRRVFAFTDLACIPRESARPVHMRFAGDVTVRVGR